jgi:predicted TPR repeat methyltransferase
VSNNLQPSPELLGQLATLYNKGRFALLEKRTKKLLGDYPSAPVLYEILGAALAGQNKLEEAAESCRAILRLQPENASAHSNLGFALREIGQLEEAVESCRRAVTLKPDHAEAHNNMAMALQSLGRLDEAIAGYRQAATIVPNYAAAHSNLGIALRAQGKFDEAVESCRRALQIEPDNGRMHGNLGVALREAGHIEDAVTSCRQAIEIDPKNAEAFNNHGIALRELGKLDDAVESYSKAIAIKPDYAEAHNNLGNVLNDLACREEALECFRRTLSLNPNHALARHMVAALTGETTESAPDEYVTKLFDEYARKFDRHLVESLGYDTPERLAELVRNALPERLTFDRGADLGCGTGLSGAAFRKLSGWLVGIDLSPEMLKQARQKRVYDEIILGNITDALTGMDNHFDLFICTDVLIYVGDAEEIFAIAAKRASPGAVFCLSTEEFDGEGYVLRPTGRYAHSDAYIETVAAGHGFKLVAKQDALIRKGEAGPIPGRHFLLEKTS